MIWIKSRMSIIIEHNGEEVWSPSLRVGHLFIEQLAAIERLVGRKSGVEPTLPDMWEIEATSFHGFILTVFDYLGRSNNGPLYALVGGCLEVAIALDARVNGAWLEPPRLTAIVARAHSVMGPIADIDSGS